MSEPADLSRTIVSSLYEEALLLADEARGAFDLSGRLDETGGDSDLARVTLSCEALRTSTRMMHAIAWLLNQRAFFAGEMSEFQLRRNGRLPPPQPETDATELAMLPAPLVELVARTRRFYARIERLDRAWQDSFLLSPTAMERLRQRLDRAVPGL